MDFYKYQALEFQSPREIRAAQEKLLRQHIKYCSENSPYYRRVFSELGLEPENISLETLTELPFTDKQELEQNNEQFLAVPPEKIADIVYSSGTTGQPTEIVYTENDLQRLAYNEHQSFAGTGIRNTDTILLTCTMDRCFVAGLAYFLGGRGIGASTIRNGHGTMDSHSRIITRARPTVIVGVPSFLNKLGEYMLRNGCDPASTPVRKLICIGEPIRQRNLASLPAGEALMKTWGATIFSTYASSETVTTFCECEQGKGGHLHPELGILEIVDEHGRSLPPGEIGEVTLMPLAVEGMPFVRFKTGDLSFSLESPCPCGRNTIRLGPILGRKQQMIKCKGTTLYPLALAKALEEIPAVTEHYVEVGSHTELSDHITLHVAVADPAPPPESIAEQLQTRLRVKPKVVIEPLRQIRETVFSPEYRKPMRFFDRRQ